MFHSRACGAWEACLRGSLDDHPECPRVGGGPARVFEGGGGPGAAAGVAQGEKVTSPALTNEGGKGTQNVCAPFFPAPPPPPPLVRHKRVKCGSVGVDIEQKFRRGRWKFSSKKLQISQQKIVNQCPKCST